VCVRAYVCVCLRHCHLPLSRPHTRMDTLLLPDTLNTICYFLTEEQFDYDPDHRGVPWIPQDLWTGLSSADFWRRLRAAFRALFTLSQVSATIRSMIRWQPLGLACVAAEKSGAVFFRPLYTTPAWEYDWDGHPRRLPFGISDTWFFLASLRAFKNFHGYHPPQREPFFSQALRRAWITAEAKSASRGTATHGRWEDNPEDPDDASSCD